jgi:hypothetical protein
MTQLAVISCFVWNHLSTFGLLTDVIGVALLFFWPPPAEPILESGADVLVFTTPEERKKNKKIWSSQLRNARIALGVVFIGFVMQLVGQIWSPN